MVPHVSNLSSHLLSYCKGIHHLLHQKFQSNCWMKLWWGHYWLQIQIQYWQQIYMKRWSKWSKCTKQIYFENLSRNGQCVQSKTTIQLVLSSREGSLLTSLADQRHPPPPPGGQIPLHRQQQHGGQVTRAAPLWSPENGAGVEEGGGWRGCGVEQNWWQRGDGRRIGA